MPVCTLFAVTLRGYNESADTFMPLVILNFDKRTAIRFRVGARKTLKAAIARSNNKVFHF